MIGTSYERDLFRNIEWTGDESHCAKLSSANELQFFDSKNFENGVSSRLKLENIESFSVSPGKRPIVALFMGGKNVFYLTPN